ncbi:MAG TPA: carbohydrate ABC transporter permease [Candidatus Hungatella pullicola]|nr:carbohydrate ABC transporter permease [Candidatus Hungatella pullicola]
MSLKRKVKSGIFQMFCLFLGLVVIFPIIYCVLISFMEPSEILSRELHLMPKYLYLVNYIKAVTKTEIFRFMLNSFIVAFVSSAVRIVTSSCAAYSFAFFDYPGKKLLFNLAIGTMIIPSDVLMVQNYFTVAGMGLLNTYMGMMVIFFVSAMNIFVIRQYFLSYSVSLKEAAHIDGCGNLRFFLRILLPTTTPALATVFISSFVGTWNTYLWPLIVTNVNEMRTAQVAITMLNSEASNDYGVVMAAATIILIPSILVFVIFQRKIVGGLMGGAVKG